jgi:serine protease Do
MVLALIASVGLAGTALAQNKPASSADPATITQDLNIARALSRSFNHASGIIAPSVVHITQMQTVYVRDSMFGPAQKRMQATGAGSGVVVTQDGYILTNNHVVDGAEKVTVKFADGRELEGRVIGVDPATDLGVVKVETKDLTAATFGDSESLQIGEWVLAVGSPFGVFDNTVTSGIVSAKGRTGLAAATDETNEDYIQTDAAINPGNSGGPLVNLDGQVVGINSQIASQNGGSVGIGFSIPSSIARAVMDQLIKNGRVDRGAIGIVMIPRTPETAAQVGYTGTDGVIVQSVQPEGPADKAGLRAGDVIVRFNGQPVNTRNRLSNAIAFSSPGTKVDVDLIRGGRGIKLQVPVADRDEIVEGNNAAKLYGFTVRTVPQQLAQRIGTGAVRVATVLRASPAAQAELQPGDIVVRVNGQPVPDATSFDAIIRSRNKATLRLDVIRGPQRGYIDIEPRQ